MAEGWKRERRQTWADLSKQTVSPTAGKYSKPFDTCSRVIAPAVRTRRESKDLAAGAPAAGDTAEMETVAEGSAGSMDG
jgi:hypothetical protein